MPLADQPPFGKGGQGGFAASDEVMFPGAIYGEATVSALRFHSSLYAHGHQVGGTNPSLVEAMGARPLSLALPRKRGRERCCGVAGSGARYFEGEHPSSPLWQRRVGGFAAHDAILSDPAEIGRMRRCLRGSGCWGSMRGCWRGGRVRCSHHVKGAEKALME